MSTHKNQEVPCRAEELVQAIAQLDSGAAAALLKAAEPQMAMNALRSIEPQAAGAILALLPAAAGSRITEALPEEV
ncbi:MAG: hypothetical protein FP829_01910, partial [Nitrospirae bacterium]|nr:hypothetical protein [Nitrospirota bacterium]